jgi:trigger factor
MSAFERNTLFTNTGGYKYMKITVEKQDNKIAVLEIELDKEVFEDALNKSFNKNRGRFTVPGFRKGKAPRAIVQRFYGESVLYEDAVDTLCPEAYQEAVEEKGLEPVSRPEIDIKQIGSGQNLIFTAKITLKPDVIIDNYKGIEVPKAEFEVTEADIDKEIERQRQSNARVLTVEDRPVKTGDTVTIDFEGFIDDVAFEGGKGENHELVIGSNQFIPGFEDQIIGKNTGDECSVTVAFPDDYHAKELAGKQSVFKVKIHAIKEKELPALDDEFAKDVSEFDTLALYRESIKKNLTETNEKRAAAANENRVINKVVELASVEIPQVMIDNYVESKIEEFGERLKYQGLELTEYIARMGMDLKSLKEQIAMDAVRDIKAQLVIEKIGIMENIQAADEDVDTKLADYAKDMKQELSEVSESMSEHEKEHIKSSIIYEKTRKFLVENAVFVKEIPADTVKEESK